MRPVLISFLVLVLFSCKKKSGDDDPIKPEDRAKAAAFTDYLQNKKLALAKYYSQTPIDYIDTDQVVKQQTDLWEYVSPWIPDDRYSFLANNEVDVEQNAIKIEGQTDAVLKLRYTVVADADGVAFNFLSHEYLYLKYRLVTYTDTSIVVNATWNNHTVFSEYKVMP